MKEKNDDLEFRHNIWAQGRVAFEYDFLPKDPTTLTPHEFRDLAVRARELMVEDSSNLWASITLLTEQSLLNGGPNFNQIFQTDYRAEIEEQRTLRQWVNLVESRISKVLYLPQGLSINTHFVTDTRPLSCAFTNEALTIHIPWGPFVADPRAFLSEVLQLLQTVEPSTPAQQGLSDTVEDGLKLIDTSLSRIDALSFSDKQILLREKTPLEAPLASNTEDYARGVIMDLLPNIFKQLQFGARILRIDKVGRKSRRGRRKRREIEYEMDILYEAIQATIELDGPHHQEERQKAWDKRKEEYLATSFDLTTFRIGITKPLWKLHLVALLLAMNNRLKVLCEK